MLKYNFCCYDLKKFCDTIESSWLNISYGEIGGSVDIYHDDGLTLEISNGWDSIPSLDFNYCPYCGSKQGKDGFVDEG
jgi:hypothetical protein